VKYSDWVIRSESATATADTNVDLRAVVGRVQGRRRRRRRKTSSDATADTTDATTTTTTTTQTTTTTTTTQVIAYEEMNGACRSDQGDEVQGFGCDTPAGVDCKSLADAASPNSFGYMYKKDETQCRVLGLKDNLARVSDASFQSHCSEGGAFMKADNISYGLGDTWWCYKAITYEEIDGACRSSSGDEVQGFGCDTPAGVDCKSLADAASPNSFGYMYKKDGTQCRVLGLKDNLAQVSDASFQSHCSEGGAFMKADNISYGLGDTWWCYKAITYEEIDGACRSDQGDEVQGFGCDTPAGVDCKSLADAASPNSFGYMYKKDGTQCRVLGLKDNLAQVSDASFQSHCSEGGAFMSATNIASGTGSTWWCYKATR